MNLKLVTLLGTQIDKDVYEVIVPTSTGEIAIFPSHEALVAEIVPGAVTVRHNKNDDDSKLEYFAVSGGVVEITQTSVKLLVEGAINSDDIVEEESRTALQRAIELRDHAADQIELDKAHQMVDRHSVRLKVAELRRRHRN